MVEIATKPLSHLLGTDFSFFEIIDESFSQREFDEKVTPILGHSNNFVQDNESMSSYGVMRGLHYKRMPYTQSKLVHCVKGAVLDVAVDIRKGSPTFGQHVSCLLTGRDEEGMKIADQ